jgi:hypothetical protein
MAVLVQVGGVAAGVDDRGRVVVLEETPIGSERPATGAGVGQLTVPPQANVAVVQALTEAVRFRVDGGAPAAAVGLRIAAADAWRLEGVKTLQAFRFLSESGAAGVLEVHYFTQELAVPPGQ